MSVNYDIVAIGKRLAWWQCIFDSTGTSLRVREKGESCQNRV